jgi:hypothetical protein
LGGVSGHQASGKIGVLCVGAETVNVGASSLSATPVLMLRVLLGQRWVEHEPRGRTDRRVSALFPLERRDRYASGTQGLHAADLDFPLPSCPTSHDRRDSARVVTMTALSTAVEQVSDAGETLHALIKEVRA